MPRSSSTETEQEPKLTMDDKMDQVLVYLHRMDRRDRLRTMGGFIRGVMALIPLILLLWSVWYFIEKGPELMSEITKQAVQQSAEYTQGSLMDQLNEYIK